jgi:nucleoside-diphosphate-sugar epimerase
MKTEPLLGNKGHLMKNILVCGGGGFIGGHLANKLKSQGNRVVVADIKNHEYFDSVGSVFMRGDLRDQSFCNDVFTHGHYDEIYQLAADMGGAGYIFTGENDADVMHNSALININILERAVEDKCPKIFYSSSACIYPERNQLDPDNPNCSEESAYPAAPDSEYGWEKLFSERLYLAFMRNKGIQVRIARFHNIFGPYGSWDNGKEKAPAAICRKVAECENGGTIDVWGDGKQTRSFLYIDECLDGVDRLMKSNFTGPVNIGSEEMISINDFTQLVASVAGKTINLNHIKGPIGVRGRNSDNNLIAEKLGWKPMQPLTDGVGKTYQWIASMVEAKRTLHV